MKITSTLQFAQEYPAAFAALPEAYQADDCLEFLIDRYKTFNGSEIYCQPKEDQIAVVGHWVSFYDKESQEWFADGCGRF